MLWLKSWRFSRIIRELKEQRRRRLRKRHLKSEFALPQSSTRLSHLLQFVRCWQISLEFNSKALLQRTGKEKESCCLLFTSSSKRGMRHFHVVVVPWRQRNVQKNVMHVQSCYFADPNLLLLCCSQCRRRLRCLSSLFWELHRLSIFCPSHSRSFIIFFWLFFHKVPRSWRLGSSYVP